jgi:hypothetical protein
MKLAKERDIIVKKFAEEFEISEELAFDEENLTPNKNNTKFFILSAITGASLGKKLYNLVDDIKSASHFINAAKTTEKAVKTGKTLMTVIPHKSKS